MAQNTNKVAAQVLKKRKATSTTLTKERKRKLIRRISSSESDRHRVQTSHAQQLPRPSTLSHQNHRETQTFYQLVGSQQQMSCPEDQDHDDNPPNSPKEDKDEDEEDEEEGVEERLQKLPQKARYRTLGKKFTLKFWPWSSPTWWGVLQANTATDLEIKIHRQFSSFVSVDMAVFTEEWLSDPFKTEVSFFTL